MTVSHTSVFTPMATGLPLGGDVDAILVDLADNHVAAPESVDQSALVAAVGAAREHGIQLSIVVIPGNPWPDSSLRDLATEVGKSERGTVVVLSDDLAGTYSDTLSRHRLERAEDLSKNWRVGHSAEAAQAFVHSVVYPERVSWTTITDVLLAGAVLAVAGLFFVKKRRKTDEVDAVVDSTATDRTLPRGAV